MEGACSTESGGENVPINAGGPAGCFQAPKQQQQQQHGWLGQCLLLSRRSGGLSGGRSGGLRVDVHGTPNALSAPPPPVSCPSRLQSPTRYQGGSFDPFAPAPDDEPPGGTPMCGPPAAARAAPPAVARKPAVDSSPVLARPAASLLQADRVQSCPPERVGRRGSRPLLRVRVKRSLSGAVAAAAGSSSGYLAQRSFDAASQPQPQQLAGCSRKRIEAELLSPPLPRKSSRTLLDDQQAADMMARLQLAPPQLGAGGGGAHPHSVPAALSLAQWVAATGSLAAAAAERPAGNGPLP